MIPPKQLPNGFDVIREEAERFQKLPSNEKCRIMAEMMRVGNFIIQNSPYREQILKKQEDDERACRLAQQRLIDQYEAKQKSMT